MPGFMIADAGGGGAEAGLQVPANTVETRRKHRWVFELIGRADGPMPSNALVLLRECTRPNFTFEEPDMHHNQEVAYFAGKQKWEPIKLVWYDAEQDPDVSKEMYTWLKGVVNIDQATVALPNVYKKQAKLSMIKGDGSVSETWTMAGCWPQNVNWSDLNYTNTEIQVVEVNMRYDRAIRK